MNFADNLEEIYDWATRSRPLPDISSYDASTAMEASDEWHRMMAGQGEGTSYSPTQPNMIMYGPQWKNPEWQGWTVQKVAGENDLLSEGNLMDHCVGSFCEDVERQHSNIYSLRDPQNRPHVTIETGGEKGYTPGGIKQIQGKSNSEPKDTYKEMIKEWISTSGDKSGIQKEINAFENLEEENPYDSPSVEEVNDLLGKILQGEENEYGLNYVLDKDIDDIIETITTTADGEASSYYSREGSYNGSITESSPYISNLALMQDLKMPRWIMDKGEWDELRKKPKESDWKNINTIENWAWEAIQEIQEDFYSYDTGLEGEYPQEGNYNTDEEYEAAMEAYQNEEQEIHKEWTKNTIKGGFAYDILDDLKSFRESGVIPSSQELFELSQKEQKRLNEEAEKKQFSEIPATASMNWYKKILAQSYQDVMSDPETYSDPDEPDHFDANRYFSIGQNQEDGDESYCWIWNGREMRTRKGGTHSMNFPDLFSWKKEDPNIYRGWADPSQKLISVIIPRIPGQVAPALDPSSLPTKLRVILGDYFPGYDTKVF